MPTYIYKDEQTGYTKEVKHSISECDNPSDETLEQITYEGRVMQRVPLASQILGVYSGGKIPKGEEKQQLIKSERKQRSYNHFKREVAPTLSNVEKAQFRRKHKDPDIGKE